MNGKIKTKTRRQHQKSPVAWWVSFVVKTMGKERTHVGVKGAIWGCLYRQFNTRTAGLLEKSSAKRRKKSKGVMWASEANPDILT